MALSDRHLRSGRLSVHEYGDRGAPTLLLLHGLTDSGECWTDLVERLGPAYRIVAPDALGHGTSDRFTPDELASPDPIEHMYAACADLLREVGPALVMGHSMGGGMAAALAAREPRLVRAAVLEDPAWFDDYPWGQHAAALRQRIVDCHAAAADPEGAIARCHDENPNWPESELPAWARAKAEVDEAFLQSGLAWLGTPWREIAARIEVPALLVTGDGEVVLRPDVLAEVARVNPSLRVEVVPGADHCVRRDRGEDFHALVEPWLAAHRP